MARNKGLLNISANFEPQIAAPFDSRDKVATKADLTLTATWQANDGSLYIYKGLKTVVTDDADPLNNGLWVLKGDDYTQIASWGQVGSGSGGGSYTLPTASGTVLGGVKVGDNLSIDGNGVLSSTDTKTIADQEDTDIVNPTNGQIMAFDGTNWYNHTPIGNLSGGAELAPYSIGEVLTERRWGDGKPIYRTTISTTFSGTATSKSHSLPNVDSIVSLKLVNNKTTTSLIGTTEGISFGWYGTTGDQRWFVYYNIATESVIIFAYQSQLFNTPVEIIAEYTKLTDTALSPVRQVGAVVLNTGEWTFSHIEDGNTVEHIKIDCGAPPVSGGTKTVTIPDFDANTYIYDVKGRFFDSVGASIPFNTPLGDTATTRIITAFVQGATGSIYFRATKWSLTEYGGHATVYRIPR